MSDELPRKFEGQAVLQKLLTRSGTLADVEDVAAAFKQAIADGVPAGVVIQALWDDEPRFEKPADARELFSNLFGLYEVLAEGGTVDLSVAQKPRLKLTKARRPDPFENEPAEAWLEAASRYFEDHPKERLKLQHAFDNRQDALLTWLDGSGLSDDGFGTATALCSDVFAFLDLGGAAPGTFDERRKSAASDGAPASLVNWVDDSLFEATHDDERPLPETEGKQVRELVMQVLTQWWANRANG